MTPVRPTRGAGPKSDVVQIRLSAADKADLLRAAEMKGLSLSAWIRMVLLTEARRERRRERE